MENMNMNENFIIVTANRYPNGDAGAIRQHAFAKIFQEIGYCPVVIGLGETTRFKCKTYDGVSYYSLRYENGGIVFRILGRMLFLHNLKRILSKVPKETIKGILVVSGGESVFKYIEKLSQQYDIPIYHDSVEWYSPSEFKKGKKDLSYIQNERLNTRIISEKYRVFAISRYLENAFSNRNIRTLRVPVIMDIVNIDCIKHKPNDEIIRIVYAGQIGGKDQLAEFVQAIELLKREDAQRIQLRIIGINKEQYENKFGKVKAELIDNQIYFMGRISREKVLEELQNTHFTVLIRPAHERYAQAGFPTKVVESLSTSTPVICNYTSDLCLYLRDGYNSIILNNNTVEACKEAIQRILLLSGDEMTAMQCNARETAEQYFDWKLYVNNFNEFCREQLGNAK